MTILVCTLSVTALGLIPQAAASSHAKAPALSGRIVFAAPEPGGEATRIYSMDPVAGAPIEAASIHNPLGSNPKWSHAGSRIAFVGGAAGGSDIFIMRADGTGVVNLTRSPGDDINPAWSPDDQWIAFARGRGGRYDVYKMRSDGRGKPVRLTRGSSSERYPAWSPDGKRIAFQSRRNASSNDQIQVMSSSGTGVKTLATEGANVSPAWSPDGTEIAFASNRTGSYDIYVMSAAGKNLSDLISDPVGCDSKDYRSCATDLDPTWGPDGHYLAFSTNRSGIRAIAVISRRAGGDVTTLTPLDRASTTPDWKPPAPATVRELRNRAQSGVLKIHADGEFGSGTGFVIGSNLVLTANHVVQGARAIYVSLNSKKILLKVVGHDDGRDVALLRSTTGLAGYRFTLAWRRAREDEPAVVLGYAAHSAHLQPLTGVIQVPDTEIPFDRQVEEGYSGSPLVRAPSPTRAAVGDAGAVIGLVTKTMREGEGTSAVSAAALCKLVVRWTRSRVIPPPAC